jgi:hypothetical protein
MVGDDAEMDVYAARWRRDCAARWCAPANTAPATKPRSMPHGGRVFDDLDAVVDYIL